MVMAGIPGRVRRSFSIQNDKTDRTLILLKKLSNWYFSRSALPYWVVLSLDCAIVMTSGYIAAYLVHDGNHFVSHFWPATYGLLLVLIPFVISFRVFHTYSGIIRFSSFVDLSRVVRACLTATLFVLFASSLLADSMTGIDLPAPMDCLVIFVITTLGMCVIRIVGKITYDELRTNPDTKKIFIYGAGPGAVAMAKGICNSDSVLFSLSGFISPDEGLVGTYLMGRPVFAVDDDPVGKMKKAGATLLAVSPIQAERFREENALINSLTGEGIHILMMPKPEEWDGHSPIQQPQVKEVDIEDLLPRDQIQIDMGAIESQLKGRSILITGAAGSIGSELARQVASFHPGHLILVDQAETPMHDLRLWAAKIPDIRVETIVATITDSSYMECIFGSYRPEYVFHAAAYKHVPMMEDNPAIAVRNNIRGTRVVADLAVKYGARKFVMVSTDKAVNPTNVMGCSKRICEIYCQSLNKAILEGRVEGVTQFVTTRFGNVLGSNGSVISIFRQQIKNGEPLTVTDPEIIRYFMLIPEACKLVLEAAVIGNGGEIFAFDMGKPVKIADLARRMIALSGARNVGIEYTGLRDGEKLYEEVLSDKEKTLPTPNPKIFIAKVPEYDYKDALLHEEELFNMTFNSSARDIAGKMMEIVPEYRSTNTKYSS